MSSIVASQAEAALHLALNVARGKGVPPAQITHQARASAGSVAQVAPKTVRDYLEQILMGPAVSDALQWLHEAGLLAIILPELEATVLFTQEMGRRHKDVWEHTKQVVVQSERRPAVRWAALLHDIGKVTTRAITPDGKVTFHGHAHIGARMFDEIAKRLAFPKPLRTRVRWLILNHLRVSHYDAAWSDSAIRRFDRQTGDYLEDLLLLSRADITSARQQNRDAARRQVDELVRRIQALREIDCQKPPLPTGLGNAIIEHFDLRPGRAVGDLKRELEAAIARDELQPHQQAEYYLDHLERSGLVATVR